MTKPSVMLQIERAMLAALSGTGAPAARVDHGNTGEYSADIMPAINVALMEWENEYGGRGTDHDSLRVMATWGVFCYAAGEDGVTATEAVDPLAVWAHQVLGDNVFGGLAVGTDVKGGKMNWNEKDGTYAVEVMLTVDVMFDVKRGDPSQNYNG